MNVFKRLVSRSILSEALSVNPRWMCSSYLRVMTHEFKGALWTVCGWRSFVISLFPSHFPATSDMSITFRSMHSEQRRCFQVEWMRKETICEMKMKKRGGMWHQNQLNILFAFTRTTQWWSSWFFFLWLEIDVVGWTWREGLLAFIQRVCSALNRSLSRARSLIQSATDDDTVY